MNNWRWYRRLRGGVWLKAWWRWWKVKPEDYDKVTALTYFEWEDYRDPS